MLLLVSVYRSQLLWLRCCRRSGAVAAVVTATVAEVAVRMIGARGFGLDDRASRGVYLGAAAVSEVNIPEEGAAAVLADAGVVNSAAGSSSYRGRLSLSLGHLGLGFQRSLVSRAQAALAAVSATSTARVGARGLNRDYRACVPVHV